MKEAKKSRWAKTNFCEDRVDDLMIESVLLVL